MAYNSFPSPAASVTVCSNQPVTNISSYLGALLMAELLVCWFLSSTPHWFTLCPKPLSHYCLPKSVSHLSYNDMRSTSPLDIDHGVSLLPCDGVLPVSGGYLLVLPCLVILKIYFLIVSSSSNQHHELSQTNPLGTQRCCDAESCQWRWFNITPTWEERSRLYYYYQEELRQAEISIMKMHQ